MTDSVYISRNGEKTKQQQKKDPEMQHLCAQDSRR